MILNTDNYNNKSTLVINIIDENGNDLYQKVLVAVNDNYMDIYEDN